MELAMQLKSNDETVRSDTIQDLEKFNNHSLATQAKKRRTFDFYAACYWKIY